MTPYISFRDKMLTAVLSNKNLMKVGKYDESQFATFEQAMVSENPVVRTVARIIKGNLDKNNEKNIYNEITEHLKNVL